MFSSWICPYDATHSEQEPGNIEKFAEEPIEGQLAADGRSFWSGGQWISSTSSDGTSRWDGHEWVPQERQFFRDVPDDAIDIDDRSMADGPAPAALRQVPDQAVFQDRHVAVGPDWLAIRPTVASPWRLVRARDVQSVAIVPPSGGRQILFLRSLTTPEPNIAVQDRLGNVVSVNVVKFSSEAAAALTPKLPADTYVTSAARRFLEGRGLPGQWGEKFNWSKSID